MLSRLLNYAQVIIRVLKTNQVIKIGSSINTHLIDFTNLSDVHSANRYVSTLLGIYL